MVTPGHKLDLSFRVKAVRDGALQEVMFSELLARRTIVSVYMKNNTPTCDRQTASLARHADEFRRTGYDLIAISRNTAGAQLRYAAANRIPFTLVSDPEDKFACAADAMIQKSMYGRTFSGPARSAFVLDANGTVLAVVEQVHAPSELRKSKAGKGRTAKSGEMDHAAQLRAILANL